MSAASANNANANPDNIIFTIKDTKLYVPFVTLSAKDNQKLSKVLRKGFERSVYWNEYKTKSENKNTANEYRCFLKSNFVVVNGFFVLIYSNQDANCKRIKTGRFFLTKGIIDNYNVIINEKNFNDKPIDFGIKRYKEIKKIISGQHENYTTECLLDYDYIKNHYKLITVDLSSSKNRIPWTVKISRQRNCC